MATPFGLAVIVAVLAVVVVIWAIVGGRKK